MRIGFAPIVLERFNLSLGAGLGRLKGKAFRIGHLGDFNELMLVGHAGGVEMGDWRRPGVPFRRGGVDAAMRSCWRHRFSGLGLGARSSAVTRV